MKCLCLQNINVKISIEKNGSMKFVIFWNTFRLIYIWELQREYVL